METLSVPMMTRSSSVSSGQDAGEEKDDAIPKPAATRRVWKPVEDEALREAIKLFGSRTGPASAWPAISRHVSVHGGRTNKDCRKRWFHTLDPALKKGRWTREEDAALRKAFSEVGTSWKEMALYVPGRTDEQVAKRWRDVLSPDLALNAPWTPDEDALLLRLFKDLGPKWTLISDSFATRNGIAIRNRFRSLRKSQTDNMQPGVSPISEAPTTSTMMTTSSSENPFFPHLQIDIASDPKNSHDMSFLDEILGSNNMTYPSISFHHDDAELLPDVEDAQDQSWFDTFYAMPPAAQGVDDHTHLHSVGSLQSHDPPWLAPYLMDEWLPDDATSSLLPVNVAASDNGASSSSTTDSSPAIGNVWGLLVALENGNESVHVSAKLIRQLLSDAAKKGA